MEFTIKIWKEEDVVKEIKNFDADSQEALDAYLELWFPECEWEII